MQVVGDHTIAWHAPPNAGSIGIEMCDMPTTASKKRWNDPEHVAMLKLVAQLTAQLSLAYNVRPWFVGVAGLRRGRHGVTTHNNVSLAFGQSTHSGPRRVAPPEVHAHGARRAASSRRGSEEEGAEEVNPNPNLIARYAKAVVAFIVPGAVIIGASVAPGSDGGSTITFAEWVTAIVACVVTSAGVAVKGNADPALAQPMTTPDDHTGEGV